MSSRPTKTLRINYAPLVNAAAVTVLGDPNEIRLSVGPKSFMGVRETGITLSPGLGKNINLQAMSHNLRYGGMVQDIPFPLTLIPVTAVNPMPSQIFAPPLKELMGILRELSAFSRALL